MSVKKEKRWKLVSVDRERQEFERAEEKSRMRHTFTPPWEKPGGGSNGAKTLKFRSERKYVADEKEKDDQEKKKRGRNDGNRQPEKELTDNDGWTAERKKSDLEPGSKRGRAGKYKGSTGGREV